MLDHEKDEAILEALKAIIGLIESPVEELEVDEEEQEKQDEEIEDEEESDEDDRGDDNDLPPVPQLSENLDEVPISNEAIKALMGKK